MGELGITVKKAEDPAEWYQQVVLKGEFADYTPVKGMIAYRPHGYRVWELIMENFDRVLKAHGVQNVYFPILIPERLLLKEAEHFKGFAPEVFWATLGGKDKLEEKMALRPTSETIIHTKMGEWVQSYRDLPLRLNQWCTMYRYETKMTKPFIRGREVLWKETHTAFATKKEAEQETEWAVNAYGDFIEEFLAIPLVRGRKTDSDKFAGAEYSLAVESLMPDGKALQSGTSHLLSQEFSKTYNVRFLDENEKWRLVWLNSYGISARLIGGLLLVHGDDRGAVLPPKIAPVQVVIIPILFKGKEQPVMKACRDLAKSLRNSGVRVEFDSREEYTAGWKFNHWELKGVPLRLEVGPRDIEKGQAVVVRRDTGKKDVVAQKGLAGTVKKKLEDVQKALFAKARKRLDESTVTAETGEQLKQAMDVGKWALVPHCGDEKCEGAMATRFEGGPRLVPFKQPAAGKNCVGCDKKPMYWVYWGRAY